MTDFPATEKVRILLSEYAALRSEILSRTNQGYQLLVVGMAAMGFFAAIYKDSPWELLLLVGALLITVYAFACWFVLRDIHKLAARVREIEIDVNDRCGEDLLVWENLSGWTKTGFWLGFRPLPRQKLENAPIPIRTTRGRVVTASNTPGTHQTGKIA